MSYIHDHTFYSDILVYTLKCMTHLKFTNIIQLISAIKICCNTPVKTGSGDRHREITQRVREREIWAEEKIDLQHGERKREGELSMERELDLKKNK